MTETLKTGARVFALKTNMFYGPKGESPYDPAMTPEQAKQFIIELAKIQRKPKNAYMYTLFQALYVG